MLLLIGIRPVGRWFERAVRVRKLGHRVDPEPPPRHKLATSSARARPADTAENGRPQPIESERPMKSSYDRRASALRTASSYSLTILPMVRRCAVSSAPLPSLLRASGSSSRSRIALAWVTGSSLGRMRPL